MQLLCPYAAAISISMSVPLYFDVCSCHVRTAVSTFYFAVYSWHVRIPVRTFVFWYSQLLCPYPSQYLCILMFTAGMSVPLSVPFILLFTAGMSVTLSVPLYFGVCRWRVRIYVRIFVFWCLQLPCPYPCQYPLFWCLQLACPYPSQYLCILINAAAMSVCSCHIHIHVSTFVFWCL